MFQVIKPCGMAAVSKKKLEKRAVPLPNTLMMTDLVTEASTLVSRMKPVLASVDTSTVNTCMQRVSLNIKHHRPPGKQVVALGQHLGLEACGPQAHVAEDGRVGRGGIGKSAQNSPCTDQASQGSTLIVNGPVNAVDTHLFCGNLLVANQSDVIRPPSFQPGNGVVVQLTVTALPAF
jgi:hypothetical protein